MKSSVTKPAAAVEQCQVKSRKTILLNDKNSVEIGPKFVGSAKSIGNHYEKNNKHNNLNKIECDLLDLWTPQDLYSRTSLHKNQKKKRYPMHKLKKLSRHVCLLARKEHQRLFFLLHSHFTNFKTQN